MQNPFFRLRNSLAFLLCVCLAPSLFSQTPWGGIIGGNTTLLQSESPYEVTNNTLVLDGATLTIEPGVELRFRDSTLLQIDGTLRAVGTEEAPIVFTKMPGSQKGWGGIFFSETAVDYDTLNGSGSVLSYAQITHTLYWHIETIFCCRYANPLSCFSSSPLIDHCEIACYNGYIAIDNSNSIIRNCNIHDASNGIVVNPISLTNFTTPTIENCYLHDLGKPSGWISWTWALDLGGPVLFRNNCVKNIECDLAVRNSRGGIGVQILDNEFSHCANGVIGSFGAGSSSQYVGNTFTDNGINLIFLACADNPQIYGNNFNSYIDYHVYASQTYQNFSPQTCSPTGTMFDLDMQNNYWGGLLPDDIDQSIYDFNDDFLEAIRIDYENRSVNPFPITEPEACSYVDKVDCNASTFAVKESLLDPVGLSVWPNPTPADVLNVRVGVAGTFDLKMLNMTGQTVISTTKTTSQAEELIQIPLYGLVGGTYILQLSTKAGQYTRRIVVME